MVYSTRHFRLARNCVPRKEYQEKKIPKPELQNFGYKSFGRTEIWPLDRWPDNLPPDSSPPDNSPPDDSPPENSPFGQFAERNIRRQTIRQTIICDDDDEFILFRFVVIINADIYFI